MIPIPQTKSPIKSPFDLSTRLKSLNVTQRDMISILKEYKHIKISEPRFSDIVNGRETTGSAIKIITTCNEIVTEWEAEKNELSRT